MERKTVLVDASSGASKQQQRRPQNCSTDASTTKMTSEVEQIAERIETRRAQRVPITRPAEKRFLRCCRKLASRPDNCISTENLHNLREKIEAEVEAQKQKGISLRWICGLLGILQDSDCLLAALDRASEQEVEDDCFSFIDFNHNGMKLVSRWPWMRSAVGKSLVILVGFYMSTPLVFCHVLHDVDVCKQSPFGRYLSAMYFTSATISTVGYGDITVSDDPNWMRHIGTLYMLVSMIVAAVAFSTAAAITASPLQSMVRRICDRFVSSPDEIQSRDQLLQARLARVRFSRLAVVALEVFLFIFIGVFASQIASAFETNPAAKWTFATSLYWATQTCLTVGYGDVSEEPHGLIIFKTFYLLLSTYVVGSSLGRLGSLKEEMSKIRRLHTWNSRPVTRRFIDEYQAYEHDDKVDQFEFLVASLVMLGRIDSDDIKPVMDKFRSLAGDKDYISVSQDISDATTEGLSEDALEEKEDKACPA